MKATLTMALIGSLIALPVAAQTSRPADQPAAPRATQQTEAKAPPLFEMKPGEWRATKLDGLDVYNPDNQKIGDISELIIDRNGKIDAVVIGVGGFLGMGEHQVAVPFEKVQWVDQPMARTVATGTTTGSGTSSTPAAGTTSAPATTTTTVDRQTGSSVTTTTEHPAGTTTARTDSGAARDAAHEAYRGYPDHAVVAMTKDQLKALPEVRYAR